MTAVQMLRLSPCLVLACALGACDSPPSPAARAIDEAKVAVRRLPAQPVLVATVTGSFTQHEAVMTGLVNFLREQGVPFDNQLIGIYPEDPDAVAVDSLDWSVAAPVDSDVDAPGPFRLETLDATLALVLESTVRRSHQDGLILKQWMLANGYVQIAPTRMSFSWRPDGDPLDMRTQIIFPVTSRKGSAHADAPVAPRNH